MLTIFLIALLGVGAAWYFYFRTEPVPPGVRIVLVGDSTVADYPGSDAAGWGEFFPQFVGPGAVVVNHSKGGRSSKTFIAEGRWKRALASRPQVVIIQFGHNDIPAKPPKQRTCADALPNPLPADPHNWYRYNLAMMVREARANGATPIIVAPMERMQVGLDGSLLPKNHDYAQAAKAVASDEGAMFIDLNTFSIDRFNELGEEAMLRFHTKLADGQPDRTHFNKAGGRFYAAEVARQIIKSRHQVASLLASPVSSESLPDAPLLVAAAA
jgi:lysophospholipase L1-like esterase